MYFVLFLIHQYVNLFSANYIQAPSEIISIKVYLFLKYFSLFLNGYYDNENKKYIFRKQKEIWSERY